ncbi:pentapeptide repeat-containing protein [Prochlorococcus sp. MIT 1307]|uniref:pentapeptide repeat-containing protein n=1 Tax=Prochlorococcus sp. MIT 1307 TaxID=3096219 RepID=UPI002A765B9C|nr:pentapeptide repeat-containing protein [Prochlorococcus sp. MIT 1307]
MTYLSSLFSRLNLAVLLSILLFALAIPFNPVFAKTPPEIRNQDELKISQDMHGKDLTGYEFVKLDLRNVDFGEADLSAAIFNNSQLQGADLRGANLEDAVAFACDFEGADLRDANLSQTLLMESTFTNADIDGADFTDAVISRIQLKQLCSIADGENSATGISTRYSLGC